MELLLSVKNTQNPYVVSVGDKVYYLKQSGSQKFYSGCSYVTDIFTRSSDKIVAIEGSVRVEDVAGVLVVVLDEETNETYKLHLRRGQFTYNYENWIYTIHGVRKVGLNEED